MYNGWGEKDFKILTSEPPRKLVCPILCSDMTVGQILIFRDQSQYTLGYYVK